MLQIRELSASEAYENISGLAEVLVDCVEGGASVSFLSPLSKSAAEEFFKGVAQGVAAGERILLAAYLDDQIVGTVQIVTATPQNQPHRADIAKLLVSRSARGQGIAAQLMEHVERVSRREGKTLLVLDTVTGGTAERLYARQGWIKVGIIPNYALFPDGRLCDTTVFYKQLV